tara:strand:- start:237 stop:476 length:240 start_codon:yes stop_codon:yes gene_type:complete
MSNTEQLEKNIAFCIDECDMDDEQVGEMLRAIESISIQSVEYFCEEFVFICEDEDNIMKYHDESYLNIADFNSLYWEGN